MSGAQFSCHAICLRETKGAMLVKLRKGGWVAEVWIPRSAIHPDSEVFGTKNLEGRIVFDFDFAVKKGLVERVEPRLHRTSQIDMVMQIVDNMAKNKRAVVPAHEAICYCPRCDSSDVHPTVEHEASTLEQLSQELRKAVEGRR